MNATTGRVTSELRPGQPAFAAHAKVEVYIAQQLPPPSQRPDRRAQRRAQSTRIRRLREMASELPFDMNCIADVG